MLAIQDALAEFQADEIVVVLHPEDEAQFGERDGRVRRQGVRGRHPGTRPRRPGPLAT